MNEAIERIGGACGYRPKLSYYHANSKGTGSALQMELHPAHDDTAGSIFLSIARQKTAGSREQGKVIMPSFDWKNKAVLKLDVSDLSQILQVMRGIQESIADGKGLFHRSMNATTVIKFEHRIEPRPGYAIDVWKKPHDGEQMHYYFVFDPSEAFFLMLAIEQSAGTIAFGIPQVIPRAKTYENVQVATPVAANDPF